MKICKECNKEFEHKRWLNICQECRNLKISNGTKIGMKNSPKAQEAIKKLNEFNKTHIWNKGLTKKSDIRVKLYSEKQSATKKEGYKIGKYKVRKGKDCNLYGKIPKNINKRGKVYRYIDVKGRHFTFKSTYELLFAQKLDEQKFIWDYEPKAFDLSNGKSYRPDFYIHDLDQWIEVKGFMWEDALEKINLFKKEYHNVLILNLNDIKNFRK